MIGVGAVALTIFDESKEPIAIEGFRDFDGAAGWTKTHLIEGGRFPAWGFVQPDYFDDPREVISMLDSADALARFLVRLEYADDQVLATVRSQFPGADADAALADAKTHKQESDEQLERQLDAEAREQEHTP